jgi:subtilase family serine protease
VSHRGQIQKITRTNATIGFRVYLGWNNPTAAVALAQAVSDPHSSSYRQYLTPGRFRQQFAPSQAQVAAVQSWLRSQGFVVNYTPKNNHYVSAQGTIGQAQAAFATQFAMYTVHGKTVRSPSTDVSIPSSLASTISGVVGLDESAAFVEPDRVVDTNGPPPAGFRNAPPLSAYWAQQLSPYAFPNGFTDIPLPSVPWTVKGHTPAQIKEAYGISGYDGAGQTVAIIDAYASPTILQDVNQWSTNRGLPTIRKL